MPPRNPQQPRKPTAKKPPPKRPAAGAKPGPKTGAKTGAKKTTGASSTRVRSHTRTTAAGKRVTVQAHNRRVVWKQAGAAWAGAGGSGLLAIGVTLEFGFTLIAAVLAVLTVLIATTAFLITGKELKPRRRMRAKVKRATARRTVRTTKGSTRKSTGGRRVGRTSTGWFK